MTRAETGNDLFIYFGLIDQNHTSRTVSVTRNRSTFYSIRENVIRSFDGERDRCLLASFCLFKL